MDNLKGNIFQGMIRLVVWILYFDTLMLTLKVLKQFRQ